MCRKIIFSLLIPSLILTVDYCSNLFCVISVLRAGSHFWGETVGTGLWIQNSFSYRWFSHGSCLWSRVASGYGFPSLEFDARVHRCVHAHAAGDIVCAQTWPWEECNRRGEGGTTGAMWTTLLNMCCKLSSARVTSKLSVDSLNRGCALGASSGCL